MPAAPEPPERELNIEWPGTILFNGIDITNERPAQIARRGIIRSFQISAVFPHLSVLQNVRIALQRKRGGSFDFWRSEKHLNEFNARAMELITDVGLAAYAELPAYLAGWQAGIMPFAINEATRFISPPKKAGRGAARGPASTVISWQPALTNASSSLRTMGSSA